MATTIALAHTSIISHDFSFFSMVKTLKSHSHSNFQVCNTISWTIITMLYIRSQECIHFLTGNLYSLINIFPFPPPSSLSPSLWETPLYFQWYHIIFVSFVPWVCCLFTLKQFWVIPATFPVWVLSYVKQRQTPCANPSYIP